MNSIRVIFNAIEWHRVLFLIFVIFLTKYCFLYGFGYDTTLTFIDVSLFALSCGFFYKATFLLSYFFKSTSKKIKPYLSTIKYTSIVFLLIGFVIGVYFSFKIQKPYFSLLFLFTSFLSFIYAKFAKQKSFLNNIIRSFLTPFAIFCVLFLDTPIDLSPKEWGIFLNLQFIIIIYLLLTFINSLHEDNLLDFCTIKEDNANNLETLPILLGRKRAKNVSLILTVFVGALLVFLTVCHINTPYLFNVFLFLNIVPYLFTTYLLIKATTTSDFIKLVKISKYISIIGIIGILAIAYYFKYVA